VVEKREEALDPALIEQTGRGVDDAEETAHGEPV